MRFVTQALILLVVAAAGAWATLTWHPRAPALYLVEEPLSDDEVDLDLVLGEWEGDVIWLDARPEDGYHEGHVPGAHLLNEQGFDDQLFDLLDVLQTASRPIVIYCSGQRCEASRKVRTQLLRRFPLENVWILRGGWPAWLAAGRPVEVGS